IIRPYDHIGGTTKMVQLDDLDVSRLVRLREMAFMTIQTNPGNYQAWVAISSRSTNTARRLKREVGADLGASGATRLAGTQNLKEKYRPLFPIVQIIETAPGRVVTPEQLQQVGLLAPEAPHKWVERTGKTAPQRWPDYQRC